MDKITIVGVAELFTYPWITPVGELPVIDERVV